MSRKEVEMSEGVERLEAGVQPLSVLLSGVPEKQPCSAPTFWGFC